ncbi:MAG: hypothetical protein K2X32_15395, partial [Phycisphaerales bacterium]|nr:hypothetical protein [Phycisphaerales bacterium]
HWLIRHSQWIPLLIAAWFCGFAVLAWAMFSVFRMHETALTVFLAYLLIPAPLFIALVSQAGTAVREMRRAGGTDMTGCRVCTSCCFDLRASPAAGVCPECGTRYSSESLAKFWTKRLPLG